MQQTRVLLQPAASDSAADKLELHGASGLGEVKS